MIMLKLYGLYVYIYACIEEAEKRPFVVQLFNGFFMVAIH